MTTSLSILLSAPEPDTQELLEQWRTTRKGSLGQLLDDLEGSVRHPSLNKKTRAATIEHFDKGAAVATGAERMQWLALVPTGRMDDANRQMTVLRSYGPDPRIASHLLALFKDPPFRSLPKLPFWVALLDLVEQSADARTHHQLETLLPQLSIAFSGPVALKLTEYVSALRDRLPTFEADTEPLTQQVATARARWIQPPDVDPDALLALYLAEPSDLTRLAVYADAATTVDDPRGEAILLSIQSENRKLTKEQRSQLRETERAHREAWLGGLSRVLISSTVKLRHTFLHAATIKPKHPGEVEAVVGDARWATARHLQIKAVADYHDANANASWRAVERMVAHPVLRNLVSLTGDLSPHLVMELCKGDPRPLEVLQLNWHFDTELPVFPLLSSTERLPRLRHFISRSSHQRMPEDWWWLQSSPLFQRLEHLQLGIGFDLLDAWWQWFQTVPLGTLELTNRWEHARVRLQREADGVSVTATQTYGSSLTDTVAWLEQLETNALARLTVRWRKGASSEPSSALQARLRQASVRVTRHVSLPS